MNTGMGARLVRVDHDTQLLSPPDMRQRVPKDHRVRHIVTQRASNAPNDKKELAANLAAIKSSVGSLATVLVDSGFLSEEAINSLERSESGVATAVRVLAAVKRERHGRRVADLEKKDDPPEPGAGASFHPGASGLRRKSIATLLRSLVAESPKPKTKVQFSPTGRTIILVGMRDDSTNPICFVGDPSPTTLYQRAGTI